MPFKPMGHSCLHDCFQEHFMLPIDAEFVAKTHLQIRRTLKANDLLLKVFLGIYFLHYRKNWRSRVDCLLPMYVSHRQGPQKIFSPASQCKTEIKILKLLIKSTY